MNGLMIERAKPHAERIDFSNKARSIHRSDSRSSVAMIAFGRSGSVHNTAQSENATAKRFHGHGLGHTTSSTNFLDELLNLPLSPYPTADVCPPSSRTLQTPGFVEGPYRMMCVVVSK
jgi:hypothetical protein